MFFESLEDRRLLNANGLFKHQAVHLKPGHVYTISKSIILRNNQRIIGSSATNPPIIRFDKNTEAGIFIMPENSYNIRIRNVKFHGKGSTPAIRVSGSSHYIGNISVSSNTGSGVIMNQAKNVLIENCTQTVYTRKGFIFGTNITNVTIRNITTYGNLYENDLRFHKFDGLYLTNIKIDGANPKTKLRGNKLAGLKQNALRIHDGKNAFINGLVATGNVTFGVMDEDNGGYSDLKKGNKKEFYRKMALTSQVTAINIHIYGHLTLATNLHFKISNARIVSWDRGEAVSFNGKYGPFKQDSKKLIRKPAVGTFDKVKTYYSSLSPKNRNINGVIKFFSKRIKTVNTAFANWIPKGNRLIDVRFNRKVVK